jgi:signal transduction histidine kinase
MPASGTWSISRLVRVGAAILFVALALAIVVAVLAIDNRNRTRTSVSHFRLGASLIDQETRGMVDQETGVRGYVITGDPNYLQPYDNGGASADEARKKLLAGFGDDVRLRPAIDAADAAIDDWRLNAGEPEKAARATDFAAAVRVEIASNAKARFDAVRDRLDSLNDVNATLLADATDRGRTAFTLVNGAVVFTVALTTVFAVLVGLLLRSLILRPLQRLRDATQAVSGGDLQRTVEAEGPAEIAGVLNDVERMRRRLTGALADARATSSQLENANEELESFSYSVSHDLRAPLRAIDGFSLALVEDYGDRLDEDGADFLNRIRAAAQRMSELIDDLLLLSRASRAPLNVDEVDLSAVADDVVERLREAHPERTVEVDVQAGLTVEADPVLIRAVLENLLANAWKFTAKRPVAHVTVSGHPVDGALEVAVADDGAGFDSAYADKLFAPFQRLHHQRDFEGTGIGLATVARIVRRHGGQVHADGVPDEGATISFTLPTGDRHLAEATNA